MNKFNLQSIKSFLTKKKVIALVVILVLVVYFVFLRGHKSEISSVEVVKYSDLSRSVRATGQVISNTDLKLSFNKGGVVKAVKVAVGDVVKQGQILAMIDQGQALANLTQSKASLLAAQAKYNKILEGASNEEINLAQVALKNAEKDLENIKSNQATLVANAYRNLLNSSVSAFPSSNQNDQTPPTISGTYTLGKEGDIRISVVQTGTSGYFNASGLVNTSVGAFSTTTPQPIGDSGLYIIFPNNFSSQSEWVISLPNKKASTYLTNYNAYKSALETQTNAVASAQSLVDQKTAELTLKTAKARNVDLDIAQAEVLSAQGALQAASATYEDTIIRAPATGTITSVDIKYGELADALKPVITLEDVENLYIEALINEANIAYLKLAQTVSITFDAFGSEKKFTGKIIHIDPSAETSDGVVNYKIKVALDVKDDTIRPGMNANIDVYAGGVNHVLSIPSVAVMKEDGKSFVNLITDKKNQKYKKIEVSTGFIGDSNLIEITSGLNEGDKVALMLNK
jgi:HlyD family secretion protein